MAEMQQEEFKFPDEIDENQGKPVEGSAEEGFEIEIEDDTPEADRNRQPVPPELVKNLEVEVSELDQYSEDAKAKMKQMKKIWNDERRAKESAERERQAAIDAAQRLMEENKRIKEMLTKGEEEYKAAVTSSTEMRIEAAKRAYKEAYEAGDAEKLMEAQEALTNAQLQLDKAKNFKLPPLQEEKTQVQTSQQPQIARPDDKVMAWQARNPWFGQDEEMTAAALGLHEKLKRQGVVIGSDEYYSVLDKTMRKRFAENFEDENEVEIEPQAAKPADKPAVKPSTVVASATRSTASKKIRLKTSQVAIAKKLGLTPEQYVRELMKLEA